MTTTEEELATAHARIAELEAQVAQLVGEGADFAKIRPLGFNPRQARLIVYLARSYPLVVSRQSIATAVSYKTDTGSKGVDVLVLKARRVLRERKLPGIIETIQGSGYRASEELARWVQKAIAVDHDEEQLRLPFGES